jgi:hypothetical protein
VTTIQLRRGDAATNPVLAAGEIVYQTTTQVLKVGDGVAAFNALPVLARPILRVVKQSATTRTSTDTLADDPELILPVKSGRHYALDMRLFYNAAAAPDLKWTVAGPVGSEIWLSTAATNGGSSLVIPGTINGTGTERGGNFWGRFYAGADGFCSFQWAQNTLGAGDVTILPGSMLELREGAS